MIIIVYRNTALRGAVQRFLRDKLTATDPHTPRANKRRKKRAEECAELAVGFMGIDLTCLWEDNET